MSIESGEWSSIRALIERTAARLAQRRRDNMLIATVVHRDPIKMLIWIAEFKNTPIPIFAFDYEVKYYDEHQLHPMTHTWPVTAVEDDELTGHVTGTCVVKDTVEVKWARWPDVRPVCPQIGQEVLILREMGNDLFPRCVGVLRSIDWQSKEIIEGAKSPDWPEG